MFATITGLCPHCDSANIYRNGSSPIGMNASSINAVTVFVIKG
ncbi:IS1 family transposase [Serratia sp. AKBS12]